MSSSKEKHMEQEISEMKQEIKKLLIDMAHMQQQVVDRYRKIYAVSKGTDWYNQLQTD